MITTNRMWESRPRYSEGGRLSDDQYDKQRRLYLEELEEKGKLPKESEPELRYLRGERKPVDWTFHKKAQAEINRLHKHMSLQKVSEHTESSYATIHKLSTASREVTVSSAKSVYYALKKVGAGDG